MANRVVVSDLSILEGGQPTARELDNFTPNVGRVRMGRNVDAMERALEKLSGQVYRTGQDLADVSKVENLRRGEDAYMRERQRYEDAVKSGQMREGENPFFVEGMNKAYARAIARDLGTQAMLDWDKEKNGKAMSNYQEWENEVVKNLREDERLKGLDEKIMSESFAPVFRQTFNQIAQRDQEYKIKAAEEKRYALLGDEIEDAVDSLAGMAENGIALDESVNALVAEAKANGMREPEKAALNMLAQLAQTRGDIGVLVNGAASLELDGVPLLDTPDGKELIYKMTVGIEDYNWKQTARGWQLSDRQDKEVGQGFITQEAFRNAKEAKERGDDVAYRANMAIALSGGNPASGNAIYAMQDRQENQLGEQFVLNFKRMAEVGNLEDMKDEYQDYLWSDFADPATEAKLVEIMEDAGATDDKYIEAVKRTDISQVITATKARIYSMDDPAIKLMGGKARERRRELQTEYLKFVHRAMREASKNNISADDMYELVAGKSELFVERHVGAQVDLTQEAMFTAIKEAEVQSYEELIDPDNPDAYDRLQEAFKRRDMLLNPSTLQQVEDLMYKRGNELDEYYTGGM